MTTTAMNGIMNETTSWISATFPAISTDGIPVILDMVFVGTPTEPKAVGVELMIRQETIERIGSNPRPTRMPAGIATAVPKPAIPSMKLPKPKAIRSIRMRRSVETPASMALIFSMAPVFSVRLYVKSAARITMMIGQSALQIPSSAAVAVLIMLSFHPKTAITIVTTSAMKHAR